MQWWRDAVIYQIYVRSFSDSNGDGVGDLEGIRARLGYLELLGVDALWLSPFYPSPMIDYGYDVADPREVDPLFGDLTAFDALLTDAHEHGLRILIDLIPNHCSAQHPWFRAAFQSPPGSPARARFHFLPGRGPDGSLPPNNWTSVFGGPAWTRLPDGEWYLHLFGPEQPDLNWTNLEIWADMEKTLRFWLERGVDGFRIDVAHGMSKPEGMPDFPVPAAQLNEGARNDPRFDHEDVHEVHRMIRAVIDHYPGRIAAGEVRLADEARLARYVRSDELHVGFNSQLQHAAFDATSVRAAVEDTLSAVTQVNSAPAWVLSDHDTARPVTRYGGGAIGVARARAMILVEMALPGAIYLYNGEELGLPDAVLPPDALRDPVRDGSGSGLPSRAPARVPVPWEGGPPGYGFSTGMPWLPMPEEYGRLTVALQLEDTGSTLSLVRQALELRKSHPGFAGHGLEWFGAPEGCLAFRRMGTTLVCALNTGSVPVPLPPGDLLLSSGPLPDGQLPPDTAVWLA